MNHQSIFRTGLVLLLAVTIAACASGKKQFDVGIQFKEAKDYANAESMLRRAASLAPKDIDIQRKLGAVIALSLVHQPRNVEVD